MYSYPLSFTKLRAAVLSPNCNHPKKKVMEAGKVGREGYGTLGEGATGEGGREGGR